MINIKKLIIKSKDKTLVDISFSIDKSLAIIGESGSGKSLTLKSLLDLLPQNIQKEIVIDSSIDLRDKNSIGFVPQNPFTALNPMRRVKEQFFESKDKIERVAKLVNLKKDTINRFPIELSGGELQRVVLAMALIKDIKLILLDEPTTALDKSTKNSILKLIKSLQDSLDIVILFVTHDINSIKEICEEIVVIKDGKIVEDGNIEQVINNPQKEYTKRLLDASFSNRSFRE
jgi:peptide/nickel transport system ATP-binding protein